MKITIRRASFYKEVSIKDGNTTLVIDLMSESDDESFAASLLDALTYLGPSESGEWHEWFVKMCNESSIEVKRA